MKAMAIFKAVLVVFWQGGLAAKAPSLRSASGTPTEEQQTLLSLKGRANASAGIQAKKPKVRGIKEYVSDPFEDYSEERFEVAAYDCGESHRVTSADKSEIRCPDRCPFFAQDKTDDDFCTFVCVREDECTQWNPETPIGDKKLRICRSCKVESCSICNADGTDTCGECRSGWRLTRDGQCESKYLWTLYIIGIVFAALFVVVTLWVVDLAMRPVTNEAGLKHGRDFRSREKIKDKKDGLGDERDPYPLDINMCSVKSSEVAGPGMVLHFNFQAAIIVWAFLVAAGWTLLALSIEIHSHGSPFVRPIGMWDLFRLGTRKFGTPRLNCIIVAWGYETQQRLMWTKVLFCYLCYLLSFGLCVFYAVRQQRIYWQMDLKTKTMKDFAALLTGLPRIWGEPDAEETLKKAVQKSTKQNVIGVSIAWEYKDNEEEVLSAIDWELFDREVKLGLAEKVEADINCPYSGYRETLWKQENSLFAGDPLAEPDENNVKEMLRKITASPFAFVVFNSETERDAAVHHSKQKQGFTIKIQGVERRVHLDVHSSEPSTVNWANFDNSSMMDKLPRFMKGLGCIFLAMMFWAVFLYAPYAYYNMTFNYDNGAEPGIAVNLVFTLVVAAGNAIMYEVCMRVSEYIGFKYKDEKETCYMVLYTVACVFNFLLDLYTTYWIAYEIAVSQGFRNYHGTKIQHLEDEHVRFKSYAIQRMLAKNTYEYLWPSTCFVPFVIEPFPTIILPYLFGTFLVRTHPEIVGRDAEAWLASTPMEMGRYADIILNVVIAVLIFYFPGGVTAKMFFFMACSHIFIYVFDQWRVLRSIPVCTFASYEIEFTSQMMLAPCVSIILACTIFKANCQEGFHCYGGWGLFLTCTIAAIAHCIVHLIVLNYVVPHYSQQPGTHGIFDKADTDKDGVVSQAEFHRSSPGIRGRGLFSTRDKDGDGVLSREEFHAEVSWKDISSQWPCSWFTSNPVHCLRSLYLGRKEDEPPCGFYAPGKEHTLQVNPKIGCHFKEEPRPGEDYDSIFG